MMKCSYCTVEHFVFTDSGSQRGLLGGVTNSVLTMWVGWSSAMDEDACPAVLSAGAAVADPKKSSVTSVEAPAAANAVLDAGIDVLTAQTWQTSTTGLQPFHIRAKFRRRPDAPTQFR